MKLLKLYSDNPNFKTLKFKSGLNIVAGLQKDSNHKKTYNGVGKSYSLHLVHYILGAKIDGSKTKDFLSDYGTFFLEFSHKEKTYKITKKFSETHYFINDKKFNAKEYPQELNKIFLNDTTDKNISFRQLFNVFARRYGKTYYTDAVLQQGMPSTDYNQKYVNFFLLGVNTQLVQEKYVIKENLTRISSTKEALKHHAKIPKEYNIKDLKEEIVELSDKKNNFIIAENYHNLKIQADDLTNRLNDIRNSIYLNREKLYKKQELLQQIQSVDIDTNIIKYIYEEAQFFFGDKVFKRFEQAQEFHNTLMKNRTERLKSDVKILTSEINNLNTDLQKIGNTRDAILKDLNAQGALEEYNSISERIKTLEMQVQNLEKYQSMLEEQKKEEIILKERNATLQKEALNYLESIKNSFEERDNQFREIVKKFFEQQSGGKLEITVANDAKYLFDLNVSINRDDSQGINEVKIFCYDFLLYQLNSNLFGFMAHDSCIFSGLDSRQKTRMFQVALEYIHNNDFQYFINIGQSDLNDVLSHDILSEKDKQEITDSIILELYDNDSSKWLFGKSFD